MRINEITQEQKVNVKCLISKCDKGKTVKDTPYLSLILEDATGVLDAKFWNLTNEQIEHYKAGQVVEVIGDSIIHRNAVQLRVRKMTVLEDEDISNYVRLAPMTRTEMEEEVKILMNEITNTNLYCVVEEVLEETKDLFYTYPAATRNHHNFVGGLAYHSISMARVALDICRQYTFLDKGLLIAGILMHDVGKIDELSGPVLPEYTNEGNLLGHISIMNNRLDRVAEKLGVNDKECVLLLKHMVLAHHGKMEFGSPVLPMIPEAEVLTLLDNLDARMYMMKQSLDTTQPGHFGPRVFALEGRMIIIEKEKMKNENRFCIIGML